MERFFVHPVPSLVPHRPMTVIIDQTAMDLHLTSGLKLKRSRKMILENRTKFGVI